MLITTIRRLQRAYTYWIMGLCGQPISIPINKLVIIFKLNACKESQHKPNVLHKIDNFFRYKNLAVNRVDTQIKITCNGNPWMSFFSEELRPVERNIQLPKYGNLKLVFFGHHEFSMTTSLYIIYRSWPCYNFSWRINFNFYPNLRKRFHIESIHCFLMGIV